MPFKIMKKYIDVIIEILQPPLCKHKNTGVFTKVNDFPSKKENYFPLEKKDYT